MVTEKSKTSGGGEKKGRGCKREEQRESERIEAKKERFKEKSVEGERGKVGGRENRENEKGLNEKVEKLEGK